MKRIAFFITMILVIPLTHASTPWTEGQVLNVFATSGLKLRSLPNLHSEVLDVVRFGDQVTVINSFDFCEDKSQRVEWIDGHWIYVEFEGIAGYLFDGYLSDLPFPGSEAEICSDGYSYAFTLAEFIEQNFNLQAVLDSSAARQVAQYDHGIKLTKRQKESSHIIEIEMPGTKINEVLNLMRTMTADKASRSQFEKSLLFIEGFDGSIEKIKVNLGDPVSLSIKENGNLLVKASGYAGC